MKGPHLLTLEEVEQAKNHVPQENITSDKDTTVSDEQERESESQSTKLVKFVNEKAVTFHDKNGFVYATSNQTGETWRIDSRVFKDWLSSSFFHDSQRVAREASIREAIATITGIGRQQGDLHEANIRVALHDGRYYLDLAEPRNSRAIEIDATGWRIIDTPPVKFIRPETMRPLPEPQSGGNIEDLWPLANIPEKSRILVITWLVECLRPETVFPLLELIGEQGSAKSSTQTALRRLIDPNAADLRAAPKSSEDIFIAACASWMVSYENLSHLGPQLQDSLCTVATGGGYAKRKLYSDTDESVISVKRPTILNGIAACVTAQDLVQRTISIELPVIKARLEEKEVTEKFDTLQPKLIGALLSIFSQALGYMAQVHIPPTERPRLADFAKLGVCVALAIGKSPEIFWTEFNAANLESIERTIEGNPVASAIMEWHKTNPGAKQYSTKEIYEKLDAYKRNDAEAWPRSPKGLGDAMRRAAPSLRALGVECSCLGKQGGTIRWIIADRQIDNAKTLTIKTAACGLEPKQCPESLQSPDDCSKYTQPSMTEQDIVDIQDFTSTPNIKQQSGEIVEVEI